MRAPRSFRGAGAATGAPEPLVFEGDACTHLLAMRLLTVTSGIALLVLAGCADDRAPLTPLPPPPVVASSATPAPLTPAPTPQPPTLPPPLATQVTNVLDSRATQVPGQPNCTDYRVTGTFQNAVRTVTGRSCRMPDGGLRVSERNPVTGQTVTTTYPAPPAGAGGPGAAYGSAATASYAAYPAYAYGGAYGPAYPFAFYDAFFFGYPFFGFGCCGFYGFHGGFYHGGFGHGGFAHGGDHR